MVVYARVCSFGYQAKVIFRACRYSQITFDLCEKTVTFFCSKYGSFKKRSEKKGCCRE